MACQLQPFWFDSSNQSSASMAAELQEEVPEEEQEDPTKTLEGVGKSWNSDELLRDRMLQKDSLLDFGTNTKKVGVITFETVSLNTTVLARLLEVWLPQNPTAKTVAIDQVREQDWVLKCFPIKLPYIV